MDDVLERYRLERLKRTRRTEHYAEETRALGVAYMRAQEAAGKGREAIADDLGIPSKTLRNWLHEAGVPPCEERAGEFRPVRMREPRPSPAVSGHLVLTTASGARLEGLSLANAIELLRTIERRAC
jgi:predicted transcriptional regulator